MFLSFYFTDIKNQDISKVKNLQRNGFANTYLKSKEIYERVTIYQIFIL